LSVIGSKFVIPCSLFQVQMLNIEQRMLNIEIRTHH